MKTFSRSVSLQSYIKLTLTYLWTTSWGLNLTGLGINGLEAVQSRQHQTERALLPYLSPTHSCLMQKLTRNCQKLMMSMTGVSRMSRYLCTRYCSILVQLLPRMPKCCHQWKGSQPALVNEFTINSTPPSIHSNLRRLSRSHDVWEPSHSLYTPWQLFLNLDINLKTL